MCGKIIKLVREKTMEFALAVLLLTQLCLIAYSNLTMIDRNLDCDSAKLLKHIITMWEQGTVAIPGWAYLTTLEWDCTTLFALPLYGLTKNIYLSCALSNILFMGLLVAVLFFLFDGKDKIHPILCANLIFLPYAVGMLDYYNMLFFAGAQYIVKIMIPLVLIGIILAAERKVKGEKSRKWLFFSALYLVLLAVSSMSSSVYVMACGIVPVGAGYLLWKLFRWERVPKRIWVLGGGTCLIVMLGMKVNTMLMGTTRAGSMVLITVYESLANVSSCFFGMFELMGGSTTDPAVRVLSIQGIGIFVKICVVLTLLLGGIAAFKKCLKKQGDLRLYLLLAVFLWNYFVLNVANVRAGSFTYEYRYHLIGMLPLICVAVIVAVQSLRKYSIQLQRILFAGGFAMLILLNGLSFRELFIRGEQNAALKEFCQYFEDTDIDVIYMYYGSNDSDICRLLDGNHLYLSLGNDGFTFAFDYYRRYQDVPMTTENIVVAVDDMIYAMGDSFLIQDVTFVKFDSVGGRSLYQVQN